MRGKRSHISKKANVRKQTSTPKGIFMTTTISSAVSESLHTVNPYSLDFAAVLKGSSILTIDLTEPGQARSRKVVSRSNARVTGKYPSWKMGRMTHWESNNELNAFHLLDCNSNIRSFSEQPCKIVYVIDGIRRVHYPDILVSTRRGKELWEIKLSTEAAQPEIRLRTQFMCRALPHWGYTYRLVYGEDLAQQPRLDNAIRLVRLGRRDATECEREFVRLSLKRQSALTWSEACAGTYGPRGREVLCHLVLDGTLSIDMNAAWTNQTHFITRKAGV
jgi:hypothetical protein